MKTTRLIPQFLFILILAACNLPEGTQLEETATSQSPAFTETASSTPPPAATPIPSATSTPLIPIAWPLDKGVNCRIGPGTEWVAAGFLLVGETAPIQGKNADATWWYVSTPNAPGSPCWVAASVTLTAGNLTGLPVISPPQASVTKVSVKLDPKEITLPGCFGPVSPIEIRGTIEVNGPVKVEWHFATEQGGSQPGHTTNFNGAGSKNVEGDSYSPPPGAGTFWVRLIIDKPGDNVGEAKYKILCP